MTLQEKEISAYKIPFLLQDVGLHISAHIDYIKQRTKTALTIEETANITMSELVKRFYQADCSGSYAKNERLQAAASELLDSRRIDGVVYCVLKGQIEYDFELERLESQCEQRNTPVFRLETDYNQQDVEQLRIRMEVHPLRERTNSKFILIRWLFLLFGFFFWTYVGKMIHQGQALNSLSRYSAAPLTWTRRRNPAATT